MMIKKEALFAMHGNYSELLVFTIHYASTIHFSWYF